MLKEKIHYLLPVLLLLIAILDMPYGYYQILRWIICGYALTIAYNNHKEEIYNLSTILFGLWAITYNPIAPIHFEKDIWIIINLLTAMTLVFKFVIEIKKAP